MVGIIIIFLLQVKNLMRRDGTKYESKQNSINRALFKTCTVNYITRINHRQPRRRGTTFCSLELFLSLFLGEQLNSIIYWLNITCLNLRRFWMWKITWTCLYQKSRPLLCFSDSLFRKWAEMKFIAVKDRKSSILRWAQIFFSQ